MDKAKSIKDRVSKGEKFENIASENNYELKGVKPFSRILPDSSQLPIPLISKILTLKLMTLTLGNVELMRF